MSAHRPPMRPVLWLALAAVALCGCVVDETDVVLRPDGSGYVRRTVAPTPAYAEMFARRYDRVVGYRTLQSEAEVERGRFGNAAKVDRVEIVRNDANEAVKVVVQYAFKDINGIELAIPALDGDVPLDVRYADLRLVVRYPEDPVKPRPRETDLRDREREYRQRHLAEGERMNGARRRFSFVFPQGRERTEATFADRNGPRVTLYDVRPGEALKRAAEVDGWLRQALVAPTRYDQNKILAEIPDTRIEIRPTVQVTLSED